MAALTSERDTVQVARSARNLSLPVKAGVVIYQGALVAVGADGYAIPAQKAENLRAAGRAEETVDNTNGADGDAVIRVSRGTFIWDNHGTNKVAVKDLMGPCYMEDDQTVGNVATGASLAGIVLAVDDNGVTVETGLAVTVTVTITQEPSE